MLSAVTRAQEDMQCPQISITGPAGLTEPGEVAPFTVVVAHSTLQLQKLEYKWTSSTGAIEDGQGTTSIRVRQLRREGLTATVEILGLPEGCPYQASEYAPYEVGPQAIAIGEVSVARPRLTKAISMEIKKTLSERPGSQLFVIVGGTVRHREEATASIIRDLSRLKINRSRITISPSTDNSASIKFYAVPPGASNPSM